MARTEWLHMIYATTDGLAVSVNSLPRETQKTVQEHTVYLAQLKDKNGCQTAAITVNHSQLSADLSIRTQAGWEEF
jgi:hypothetical protein